MPLLVDDAPALPLDAQGILELAARSMFQLFSSVSQGMFLVDLSGRIVWVNEGYQRFLPDLGFSSLDQFLGRMVEEVIPNTGMRQSTFDLFLLYGIGLLGVLMRRFDFPTAPVVVGMILGPLAEAQMRNAVSIGEGSWLVFVQRPMSLTLLIIVLAVLILPRLFQHMARRKLARLQQLDA